MEDMYRQEDLQMMLEEFVSQSQRRDASLAWFESLLGVWSATIETGDTVLVVEMGGSRFRMAVGQLQNGMVTWLAEPMMSLPKNEHSDAEAFMDWLVDEVLDLTALYQPKIFSLILSYPHKVWKDGDDITGQVTAQTKGLRVPGIEQMDIAAAVKQRLPEIERVVVLNDATALVLSEQAAQMGLIVGTGGNIGAIHPESNWVCNVEAGNFDGIVMSEAIRVVDAEEHSGRQLMEKASTGRYLRQILWEEAKLRRFSESELGKLQVWLEQEGSAGVDALAADRAVTLGWIEESLQELRELAGGGMTRSAQLWGMAVAGVLDLNQITGMTRLPVTGGVILNNDWYQEILIQTVDDLVGVKVEIVEIVDPITGGVVAANVMKSQSID